MCVCPCGETYTDVLVIGGFAAQANGWRWTIWPLLWLSGAALAFFFVFLPDPSSSASVFAVFESAHGLTICARSSTAVPCACAA